MAIPEDDALAGVLVDHDDRELIRDVADHRVGHVDLPPGQLFAQTAAVVVGAGGADVLRPQPHRRAGAERRRHLPAAATASGC